VDYGALTINGSKQDKLDMLFLKDGYNGDQIKFEQDIHKSLETFFSIEPYTSEKNKFNIYVAQDNPDLNCDNYCQGTSDIERLVCCDNEPINDFLKYANMDNVIVLTNDHSGGGAGWNNSVASLDDTSLRVSHELSHAIGKLKDEYSYGPYPGQDEYSNFNGNCATTLEQCEDWEQEFPGEIECTKGCQYDEWYRSVPNSLMQCVDEWNPACWKLSPVAEKITREELNKNYK